MVYESIDHGNDVTCRHAVPVVLFLVFRKKGKCYCKKQIDHNFHGLHSYRIDAIKRSKLCSETTRLRLAVPHEFVNISYFLTVFK